MRVKRKCCINLFHDYHMKNKFKSKIRIINNNKKELFLSDPTLHTQLLYF